jgi:hypothetical protein
MTPLASIPGQLISIVLVLSNSVHKRVLRVDGLPQRMIIVAKLSKPRFVDCGFLLFAVSVFIYANNPHQLTNPRPTQRPILHNQSRHATRRQQPAQDTLETTSFSVMATRSAASSVTSHHRTRSRMDEVVQAAATSQHASQPSISPQRGRKRKVSLPLVMFDAESTLVRCGTPCRRA